jgi:hypothetical protein
VDDGGGSAALTDGPEALHRDAGTLTAEAGDILHKYALVPSGEFESRINRGLLLDAMCDAQEEAIKHSQRRLKSGSEFYLAACAAYQLVYRHREIFKNNVPTFVPPRAGIASAFHQDTITIQDCALELAEKILGKTREVNLVPEGFKSEFAAQPVKEFLRLLDRVPGQSQSTIRATAPRLAKELRKLARKKTRLDRVGETVRRRIRLYPLASAGSGIVVGGLIIGVVAYCLWPQAPVVPPAVGTSEAVTAAPALPNVTEQVSAYVVNDEQHQITIDPWSSPPTTPVVVKLGDDDHNQLHIEVKLGLKDGLHAGVDLSVQWAPGTVPVASQTKISNAVNKTPQRAPHDLVDQLDPLALSLDKDQDQTPTIVTMMMSTNPNDNRDNAGKITPGTFHCGYNPAPVSLFVSPSGNSDPDKKLITVIPVYVLKTCTN